MELYEILGVEKRATDDELKRAYKKMALKLHPDRNYDNVDEATAQFVKVQAAYDVLSDPQERAWYDAHGIAGGMGFSKYDNDAGAGKVTTAEELKRYFDPMLYANVTDTPDGIYQVAASIFSRLAREEAEAVFDQGLDDDDYAQLPTFGDSQSNWARETKQFYDVWLNFTSRKTFAWHDQYRTKDAPDRRTRRAMENENKKARDAARKEFNETVRALISFVRKRDPRFKLRQKHTGATKMSAKAQANAAAAQASRDRKANVQRREGYEEQEWEKIEDEDIEEFFSDIEEKKRARRRAKNGFDESPDDDSNSGDDESVTDGGAENEDEDEEVIDLFECIVCDKTFKTRKQFVSHEQSKKHIKALQKLKYEMQKEGINLGIDSDKNSPNCSQSKSYNSKPDLEESDFDSEDEEEEFVPQKKQAPKPSFSVLMQDDDDDDEEEKEDVPAFASKTSATAQKGKKSIQDLLSQLEGTKLQSGGGANDSDDDDWSTNTKSKKGKKKGKQAAAAGGSKKKQNGNKSDATTIPRELQGFLAAEDSANLGDAAAGDNASGNGRQLGKAKLKKLKRTQLNDVSLTCTVCHTEFPSRNKLFDHVKVSGHAAAPPNTGKRK
jgi:DnaJ family protein A protein 5